jgi:nondiscriminating aspartyl-tRNA synthetase
VVQFERELLTDMFENLNRKYGDVIKEYRADLLPSMLGVACWEFDACLEMLRAEFGRTDLEDDLDPEAERQLCERAARETGIPAVFVLGFPLAARPFLHRSEGSQRFGQQF